MKKLSIEEKARAYDEALKVLHKYDGANIMFSQSLKEEMFPELKESKDERIRKAIIKHFKVGTWYTSFYGFSKSEIINYLEKQGEQKHVINQLKFKIGDVIKRRNSSVTYTVTKMDTSCFQLDGGHWLKLDRMSEFELVDEKTANKVEPKFKVGDKIRYLKCGGTIMTIEKIENGEYIFGNNMGHITIESGNKWYLVDIIEQKPTWSEEDETAIHLACEFIQHHSRKGDSINGIDCTELVKILESFKDRVLLHSRQGWSEEDETKIKSIIVLLKSPSLCAMEGNKGIIAANIKYLNSLKERIGNFNDGYKVGFSEAKYNQWKPSDEQITWLYRATDEAKKDSRMKQVLNELLEQLKKLKEE